MCCVPARAERRSRGARCRELWGLLTRQEDAYAGEWRARNVFLLGFFFFFLFFLAKTVVYATLCCGTVSPAWITFHPNLRPSMVRVGVCVRHLPAPNGGGGFFSFFLKARQRHDAH